MEARRLAHEARWPEAIKVLEGAQSRLELGAGDQSLGSRVASTLESYKAQERDRKFVVALDEARLAGALCQI